LGIANFAGIVNSADSRAPAKRRPGSEIVVAFADPRVQPVTVLRGGGFEPPDLDLFPPASSLDFDRVAFAVDGAESSHGTDPRMWRPALAGPQGPMQVSAAAALEKPDGFLASGERRRERFLHCATRSPAHG
jgi:hypothetical protein